jgi:hypothetical protein
MIVPSIEPQRSTWRAQEDPVFQTWIIWGYFAVRLYQEYEFDSMKDPLPETLIMSTAVTIVKRFTLRRNSRTVSRLGGSLEFERS